MKFKIRCRYRITMRTMVHALAHRSHSISKKISATFHQPSVLIARDALWSAEFSRANNTKEIRKLCVLSCTSTTCKSCTCHFDSSIRGNIH